MWQLADAPLPDSVHTPPESNDPLESLLMLTVPDGVVAPLLAMLVTVAVQVVAWPVTTPLGLQLRLVAVVYLGTGSAMPSGAVPVAMVAAVLGVSVPVVGSTSYWETVLSLRLVT